MKVLISIFIILIATLNSCSQNFEGRTVLGEEFAQRNVENAIKDKSYQPFYDTLIKNKETAIAIAEPILFEIYGKKNIRSERPYECYLIDGYWYISGTLPKGTLGGVFEIIIYSKDARVVKIIHGK